MNDEFEKLEDDVVEASTPKLESNLVKQYLNLVKRRFIVIILFGLCGFIPVWYLIKKSPVVYVGRFEVLLEPFTSEEKLTDASILTRTTGLVNQGASTLDYPTILRILKSNTILSKIAAKTNERFPDISQEFILEDLQKNLAVERVITGQSRFDITKIIEVSYQNNNPDLVEAVLESAAAEFIQYSLEEREQSLSHGVKFINEQIPKLQTKINSIQDQKKKIQTKYQLVNPQDKGDALFASKVQNEQDLVSTERELKEAKILADKLREDLGLSAEESLIASTLSQNPERQILIAELQKIEAEIANKSAIFTENNPLIQNLQEQKNNLSQLLNEKNKEIISEQNLDSLNPKILVYQDSNRLTLVQNLIESQNQIDILSARYQSLLDLQAKINRELAIIPDLINEYNELERELVLNTNMLNQLSTQRETLSVEIAQKKTPWQLISNPTIPRDQNGVVINYPPHFKKKLVTSLGGGLVLGFLIAILWEKKRDIYYEKGDIENSFSSPILGEIKISAYITNKLFGTHRQKLKQENSLTEVNSIFTHFTSNSKSPAINLIAVEKENQKNFQELATNLYFNFPKKNQNSNQNSILVCSLSPEDQQALITVNIAKNLANIGQKVLVIDVNFREPEIHKFFQIDNQEGLSDLLKDTTQKQPKNNLIINIQDNLGIIPTGEKTKELPNNLASEQTLSLISSISQDDNFVIYNSSFFLEDYELCLLAEKTQGILMVVKLKSTSQSLLQKAIKRIQDYQLNLIGFVVLF
jgi:uncharacterized protein involved in exopolysaccharide biosynthesis/Mrp family chromosome partitioning ATPase